MATETKPGLAGVVEAVAKIAVKLNEAQPEKPRQVKGGKKEVEAKKEKARKLAKRLADTQERPNVEAELQKIKLETADLQEAKIQLGAALAQPQAKNADWLVKSASDIQHNPDAAIFAAKIAQADPELQNDPYYLLSEGTKFMWQTSGRWDLTPEAFKEAHAVLRKVYDRVGELAKTTPDFEKTIPDKIIKEALLPEARMGMMPGATPPAPEVYNEADPSKETVIINDDLVQKLKEVNYNLRNNSRYKDDVHRLNNDIQEISDLGRKNRNIPEPQVNEAIERINTLIEIAEHKGAGRAGRRMGAATGPSTGPNWIDEIPMVDTAGNPIPITHPDLQRGVEELRGLSSGHDWESIDKIFSELYGKRADFSVDEQDYFDKLFKIAAKKVEPGMRGAHWAPTPNEIRELQTSTVARDKKFYDLIKKVLDNPNEEAYKQFGLYEKHNFDVFTEIIGHTTDNKGQLVGDKLGAHYQNLFDTIMRLSDADYWAAHPVGDAEGLQKHMNFFKNGFAIEAISDPIAEQMMPCYEQAAEFIRDMHDQFLPNELFSHHAARYRTYIDDLAEKFFRQRVEAGAVRDYKRDPATGLPELDNSKGIKGRKIALEDKPLTVDQLESDVYRLRMKAAKRMGKGMGIMTLRFIDTLAFTRTPGDHVMSDGFNGEFTQKIAGFSSKPYGGITRWSDFMSEFLRMYGMGDTLAIAWLNSLAGSPLSAEGNALKWNLDQVVDVMDAAATGDKASIEKKYGEGIVRMMDRLEEFGFTGRMGGQSLWGTLDATLGWNDLDRERLGGSMRLAIVEVLADEMLKGEFMEAQSNDPKWKKTIDAQTRWLQEKLGEDRGFIREKVLHDNYWKERFESLVTTYKAYVWTQYIMRNPQGAAVHVFVEYGQKPKKNPADPKEEVKLYRAKLKSKILHEIFKPADLQSYQSLSDEPHFLEGGLVVERDIATGRELTSAQYALMERVRLLDGDLMAVQSYAMNNPDDPNDLTRGRPRDIVDADFDKCIKGNITLQEGDITVTVDGGTRRHQAKKYFKLVQQEFFGRAQGDSGSGWDFQQWRDALGVTLKDDKLEFTKDKIDTKEKVDIIFKQARDAKRGDILLTRKQVDKRISVHIGTEDVQWRYLDLNVLGERNWGRSGNDFLTKAKTDQLIMEHTHMLTGRPDRDKLVEAIQKIGITRKGQDPKFAAMDAWFITKADWDVYRQRLFGWVPLAGRIVPGILHKPLSIAQKNLGPEMADAWSINNGLEFWQKVGQTRVIPYKRIIDGKDFGPYTMKSLKREMGVSNLLAIGELILIGSFLAAAGMMFEALKKSQEEDR